MAEINTDELNILSASDEAFDYDEFIEHYFDVMQISERQKKERIDAAKEFFDIILYFLIWCEEFPEEVETEEVIRQFENDYKEKIYEFSEPSDYLASYVTLFIRNLIDVTMQHLGEEYFTSVERAANVAVNESNLIYGHEELQQAIDMGYTKKTWKTERDGRVRHTHAEIEGWTIPIDQPFLVGESLMMFPKDQYTFNADPKEIVNCRCVCSFS